MDPVSAHSGTARKAPKLTESFFLQIPRWRFGTLKVGQSCILDLFRPGSSPLFLVHRDTKVWGSTANRFDPERWADGAGAPMPGAFFPFSYGPRNCLGGSTIPQL